MLTGDKQVSNAGTNRLGVVKSLASVLTGDKQVTFKRIL